MSRRPTFSIFCACGVPATELDAFKAQLTEFFKNPNEYTICTNYSVEVIQFNRGQFPRWTFTCAGLPVAELNQFREDLRKAVAEQDFIAVQFPVEATYIEVD